ncbi:hypothetical protein ZPAH1_orf00093 [Aeromonas phage ZPAH1]|nr:hypothetical protein ASwh1_45 [Aeromonas phage Aswh_1]QQG33855.1 hypothetical protein ZPAH1_orf00093 [Aeromonas phage ZPAH1]
MKLILKTSELTEMWCFSSPDVMNHLNEETWKVYYKIYEIVKHSKYVESIELSYDEYNLIKDFL